jgi:hypothetical protein
MFSHWILVERRVPASGLAFAQEDMPWRTEEHGSV